MSVDGGSNPVRRALRAESAGSCPYLVAGLEGTPAPPSPTSLQPGPYYRFWHGYQVLTRPILAVSGVQGIRIAGIALLFAGLLLLGLGVVRLAGIVVAVALVAPLVLLTNFVELEYSFPHALDVFLALAGGGALCLARARIGGDLWRLGAAALAAGAVFNYLTFLLTPPLALALVAFCPVLWSATLGGAGWRRLGLVRGAVAGAAWLAGYGGTFVCKWLLAAAAFGWRPVWDDVRRTVSYRISGTDSVRPHHGFLAPLRATLDAYGTETEVIVLVVAALLLAYAVSRRGRGALLDFAVLAAPAAIPFVWLVILREHSNLHWWFTYRSLAISFGIVFASAILAARERPRQPA